MVEVSFLWGFALSSLCLHTQNRSEGSHHLCLCISTGSHLQRVPSWGAVSSPFLVSLGSWGVLEISADLYLVNFAVIFVACCDFFFFSFKVNCNFFTSIYSYSSLLIGGVGVVKPEGG